MNLHQTLCWRKEFATPKDEGLNVPQQDGRRERSQRQRKEWTCDWWVATKEVEQATIAVRKNLKSWKRR